MISVEVGIIGDISANQLSMNYGRYVFSQLTDFIPRYELEKCVNKYNGDYRIRELKCRDQFLAMAFGQITCRESMRSIVACLDAHREKLYHMGFRSVIARKTLLDANERRDWRIYEEFAEILISEARSLYAGDKEFEFELGGAVYALDSTTIDLCITVFRWANFRRTKAAVKLHTLLDICGGIPTFIYITDGKFHDVNILDILETEAGAYYIMDKGYIDYRRLYRINAGRAFFITRAKANARFRRVYSCKISAEAHKAGIRCDQIIRFTGYYASEHYPDKLRRIKYYNKEQDRHYVFLTNNFTLDTQAIADLYKARWKIELFFRWIKYNLKIRVFWGHSVNAVKTQIWIAVCTYLIVAIMKKKLKLQQSMHEILQILSVSVFDRNGLDKLFAEKQLQNNNTEVQKALF